MSELFANPVLIEITAAEGGAVSFVATHRKVQTRRRTDYTNVKKSIAEHLAQVSRKAQGKEIGAVLFNAVIPTGETGMEPLGFVIADSSGMRGAPDVPSDEQVAHWTKEHKSWKRSNPFPRRRVLETSPPAPPADRHRDAGEWGDIPTVDDDGYDAEAVSRLKPAVAPPAEEGVFARAMVEQSMEPAPSSRREARVQHTEQIPPADEPKDEPDEAQDAPARPTRASELPSLMDRDKHDQNAQEGVRGALNRLGVGFEFPPSKDEEYRRKRKRSILAGWNGTKFVTVVDEKGGTCKTPTAMLLASALSLYGRGSVILRDGNPTGNAHERGEFTPPLGLRADGTPVNDEDLARYFMAHQYKPLDDTTMARFLHFHTTDGYGLVATADSGEDEDAQMNTEEVDATYEAVTPHASAVVTDTGNNPFDRRDRMVLARTDQLVIPITTFDDKENGARKTATRLEKRDQHGEDLVSNAIMVIHTAGTSRGHRAMAEAMAERWEPIVRHIDIVPFDRHISSNSLRFGDLALPTQSAMLDAAAAVADGFRSA